MSVAKPEGYNWLGTAAAVLLIFSGCSGSAPAATGIPTSVPNEVATAGATAPPANAGPTPTAEPSWATDLALIDQQVRLHHPGPFTNHSEDEWKAKLAELAVSLPQATNEDESFVELGSLVALLDTHSGLSSYQQSRDYYVLLYRFPEGWYVVAAQDDSLIGTRLVSINGHSADEVEATLRTLVPHDNESGALENMQGLFSNVEWLHGSGVVTDVEAPDYVFEAHGTQLHPDLEPKMSYDWEAVLHVIGGLLGDAPEAVARRGERIWTRLDKDRHLILVSVNDYGDMIDANSDVIDAISSGDADRVILDMRYLQGGSGDIQILNLLTENRQINRPGGLTALIGRENVSAGTDVAHWLDSKTDALLVGEETPARADSYRCECLEIDLPYSKHFVSIPTHVDHNGDERNSIPPDVPMVLHAEDFFAGRDPVVDAVLNDELPTPEPTI